LECPTRSRSTRNPFAFRSAKHAFIATEPIIESWKTRAGHWVVESLGPRGEVDERRAFRAQESWEETVEAIDPGGDGNRYARLGLEAGEASAIDILDRYAVMADTLRAEFNHHADALGLNDAFWICFTTSPQPRTYREGTTRLTDIFARDPILSRSGFTYRGIRKTRQILTRVETGSFAATKAAASHANSGVLMPHYLNTPTITAELDASIAIFQSALEGVVMRGIDQKTVAERLGKSVADLDRMRGVAARAGLMAALGLDGAKDSGEPSGHLHFRATDRRLEDLYLIHRTLRHMQAHYANRRVSGWTICLCWRLPRASAARCSRRISDPGIAARPDACRRRCAPGRSRCRHWRTDMSWAEHDRILGNLRPPRALFSTAPDGASEAAVTPDPRHHFWVMRTADPALVLNCDWPLDFAQPVAEDSLLTDWPADLLTIKLAAIEALRGQYLSLESGQAIQTLVYHLCWIVRWRAVHGIPRMQDITPAMFDAFCGSLGQGGFASLSPWMTG